MRGQELRRGIIIDIIIISILRNMPTDNTASLPSVNTIALGVVCGDKYTHHTFTPVIKHH